MNPPSYRHQLRIAEVCRTAGDTVGSERALNAFLDITMPMADAHYAVEQHAVYTDVATALRDLIHLMRQKNDLPGATSVALQAIEFFGAQNARATKVSPRVRADMYALVAECLPDPAMQSQFFALAAQDFLQLGQATLASGALVGQSRALTQAAQYHQAHEAALAACKVAQSADSVVAETWAVHQLSELFLVAGDIQASIGVIATFLDSSHTTAAARDVLYARAQLTETLMQRYQVIGQEEAARVARDDAAQLFRRVGEPQQAARLLNDHLFNDH